MQDTYRIAIGADDAGIVMKDAMAAYLTDRGFPVTDMSAAPSEDYPDVAERVAQSVARGEHERAVLICGTGIGMAIAANKVAGIRAAQIPDSYSAERARKSNDAQIACFGNRTMGVEAALVCLEHWLVSEFAGGGSAPKVEKIKQVESRNLRAA
ncbi:RpiB/LacA/LacB family sugar-phosphate isomerase [Streptomyces pinistramenti]|uniref:RpiB/LacA/LacB family sugar-phosphate isomerase n=1 Tax=Streptomyces pinistramenti TaxID=2884812 RepID=UPI001D05E681|nr:RpiB/LacA/LacB family sugar-phosphate isomerase [Streptomyces pinistramenti]MCB5910226.1 RpiB/LacA/LacB family sugar-phosphate isomerase [Streptomyces pinistramenti]